MRCCQISGPAPPRWRDGRDGRTGLCRLVEQPRCGPMSSIYREPSVNGRHRQAGSAPVSATSRPRHVDDLQLLDVGEDARKGLGTYIILTTSRAPPAPAWPMSICYWVEVSDRMAYKAISSRWSALVATAGAHGCSRTVAVAGRAPPPAHAPAAFSSTPEGALASAAADFAPRNSMTAA